MLHVASDAPSLLAACVFAVVGFPSKAHPRARLPTEPTSPNVGPRQKRVCGWFRKRFPAGVMSISSILYTLEMWHAHSGAAPLRLGLGRELCSPDAVRQSSML